LNPRGGLCSQTITSFSERTGSKLFLRQTGMPAAILSAPVADSESLPAHYARRWDARQREESAWTFRLDAINAGRTS
jgi:hypothetical protein